MAGDHPEVQRRGTPVSLRIGQGVDAHRLEAGHRLILGGVDIPFERGLAAHSDGDVLLHAVTDALLGAMGLGDIGQHFPDTDAAWRGADSRDLLRRVVAMVRQQGAVVVNVDATLIAQRPKLQSFLPAMMANMASDLALESEAVNVKATTLEWMGFTGREEGIAAMAVIMVDRPAADRA